MIGKQRILIVDDDENIAELISLYLTKECFDTKIVFNGEDALSTFETYEPNLILLDLMLPGIDGYQVCREIRAKSGVPIIMLSAKGEIFDKVLGLELGADDYILKPFDSKEMIARVRAVLRRYHPIKNEPSQAEKPKCVEYEGLTINLTNYSVLLTETLLKCRQKNWSFYTVSPHLRIRYLQGSSSLTVYGVMNISVTPALSTSISNVSGKNLKIILIGN